MPLAVVARAVQGLARVARRTCRAAAAARPAIHRPSAAAAATGTTTDSPQVAVEGVDLLAGQVGLVGADARAVRAVPEEAGRAAPADQVGADPADPADQGVAGLADPAGHGAAGLRRVRAVQVVVAAPRRVRAARAAGAAAFRAPGDAAEAGQAVTPAAGVAKGRRQALAVAVREPQRASTRPLAPPARALPAPRLPLRVSPVRRAPLSLPSALPYPA